MRFFIRFIGLIVLALGFIGIIVDGTRSMANGAFWFMSVRDLCDTLFSNGIEALQASIIAHTPAWLWDPVFVSILQLPASVVGFAIGAFLVWFGNRKPDSSAFRTMTPLR